MATTQEAQQTITLADEDLIQTTTRTRHLYFQEVAIQQLTVLIHRPLETTAEKTAYLLVHTIALAIVITLIQDQVPAHQVAEITEEAVEVAEEEVDKTAYLFYKN